MNNTVRDFPAFFLHLPRTAGTTLNAILRDNFAPEHILSVYKAEDYDRHASHSPDELQDIRLFMGHLLPTSYDPPALYGQPVRLFTFVREPIDRVVSEYRFLYTWKAHHLYAYLHDNAIGFRQYLLSDARPLRYRGRNFMTRCISGMDVGTHSLPKAALARAKHHLEKVFDFIGVQERFSESLLLLGDFLGLHSLLHEKRNALTPHAGPDISTEDRELARECNQADSELYAFATALLEARVAAHGAVFAQRLKQFHALNANYQKVCSLLMRRANAHHTEAIALPKDGRW